MGVTTFSLFRIASSLETADEKRSIFSGYILGNPALLKATGLSIVTIVLATELGILKNVLDMTNLTGEQWLVCIGVALSLIVVEEVKKALKVRTEEEPVAAPAPGRRLVDRSCHRSVGPAHRNGPGSGDSNAGSPAFESCGPTNDPGCRVT